MAKNLLDLRFCVNANTGFISGVWRLWITRHADVYLAMRWSGGIYKYSFHKSGICRKAFTKEYSAKSVLSDRLMFSWIRSPILPAGTGQAVRVAWLGIPTDFLSYCPDFISDSVVCIPASPSSGATYIELVFTAESEKDVKDIYIANPGHNLLTYTPLPDGIAFIVSWYHADWVNEDLRVSGDGKGNDIIFSAHDPFKTGRPIRIATEEKPSDGDAVVIRELGGYLAQS